ncbi:MAG: carotenoid 1,2-hydratase [Halieaceae bacterium]|jgi:carotenoid 1,2-hydratase|nr:carotenoid 1,2-hydratase [Halieaceae bacterium]
MDVDSRSEGPTTAAAAAADGSATALPPRYERRAADIDFAARVAPGGYLWWYVDAVSDDGREALTLIVFVGSVFSPYYARARNGGAVDAEQHCAFNTILYGPGTRKRWSMTERSARQLERSRHHYRLGPSALHWDGRRLTADVNERCVPMPRRMQGQIRVTPSTITEHSLLLDYRGRHRWNPLGPLAEVEVDFPGLGVHWSGHGYLDSNEGSEPLADGFDSWDWARLRMDGGDCAVRYEAREHGRQPHRLALRFGADGSITSEQPSASAPLPPTSIWRMNRRMPGAGDPHQLLKTLEDTPFYARSLIAANIGGERGTGLHESLCMQRFTRSWVQTLLPFRMPRLA